MDLLIIIFYILSFLAVYVQIFFLVTFFENKKGINIRKDKLILKNYPTVTIIVPCYNEEKAVSLTVDSLLNLNYPKGKLEIIVVDDGSKDNTWSVLQKYISNKRIKLLQKENGGKHTALNLGIKHSTSDFVGCLDSDSSVHPEALKRIITFFDNEKVMAVAPSIVVRNPKNIIEYAQRAEFDMAHYNKKMLAFLKGIHVTPGPFSIFRREVFEKIGPYRKAHNTEDQEIALRMHKHGLLIDHCPDAYVYAGSPNTIPKLYKQRVRWIYGFIKNALDYKEFFFKPKYGTVGLFTLPSGFISITGTMFLLMFFLFRFFNFIADKVIQARAAGFASLFGTNISFDLFFLNTQTFLFISIILYVLVVIALLNGRRMIYGRKMLSWDIPLFIGIYAILAPIWLTKAVFNAFRSHESSWVGERDYSLEEVKL
ncbi:MAG: glycosyltransferase family 2 protein [Candidatus Pacebacteria bacterium]|nr:glycosyltransferase family 2 protein [Candidatus Paceibacterota bacterium]